MTTVTKKYSRRYILKKKPNKQKNPKKPNNNTRNQETQPHFLFE